MTHLLIRKESETETIRHNEIRNSSLGMESKFDIVRMHFGK